MFLIIGQTIRIECDEDYNIYTKCFLRTLILLQMFIFVKYVNLYQYNQQFDLWNFNSRFQWRYKPASDLFLVFNSNEVLMPKEVKSWNINFKINYWLDFN